MFRQLTKGLKTPALDNGPTSLIYSTSISTSNSLVLGCGHMRDFVAMIFDLDGVIIDTETLHARAKRIAFNRHGIRVPDRLYAEFRGRSDRDMVEQVVKTFGPVGLTPDVVLQHKHEVFNALGKQIQLVPGVMEFIGAARRRFAKLAVATSATRHNQRFAFERFGLDPFFDVVITAEDIVHTKPHPEPYATAARRLGFDPDSCLVVEDSPNGIVSATDAGCVVVGITTSFGADELAKAAPDYLVGSFSELATLLRFPSDA
jgi:beta-phosphoglucomutase